MDQFKRIWDSIDRKRLMPLMIVRPNEATLVLDEAMPQFGTKAELTQYLQEMEPTIASIIALSKQPTEQFGEPPETTDEAPDAHMQYPRAWLQNFVRMLQADAAWQWELGHADAAEERIAANLRLSRWLLEQKQDALSPTVGIGILAQECRRIELLFEDGFGKKLSAGATVDLHQVLESFDGNDPGNLLTGWAARAEQNVQWFRQQLVGDDAGAKYAKYLQENGMYRGAAERIRKDEPQLAGDLSAFDDTFPEKEAADYVRNLTSKQLNDAIDEAERRIDPMGKALLAQDAGAIQELSAAISADATQIARCIIGPVRPVLDLSRMTRKSLSGAKALVEERIK
ncbi:MAG: hypothetical protein U0570_03445 [Phycisphaerales bacterium]